MKFLKVTIAFFLVATLATAVSAWMTAPVACRLAGAMEQCMDHWRPACDALYAKTGLEAPPASCAQRMSVVLVSAALSAALMVALAAAYMATLVNLAVNGVATLAFGRSGVLREDDPDDVEVGQVVHQLIEAESDPEGLAMRIIEAAEIARPRLEPVHQKMHDEIEYGEPRQRRREPQADRESENRVH